MAPKWLDNLGSALADALIPGHYKPDDINAQKPKEGISQYLKGIAQDSSVSTMTPKQLDAALKEAQGNLGGIGKDLPGASSTEISEATKALEKGYSPSQVASGVFGDTGSKKPPSNTAETAAIEKELSSGPWAQLSKALVTQYDQALAPVEAAVSGSTGSQGEADAANQALASLGLSSGSSAGSWLGSQLGAANASAAPVEAAMGAYGKQYAAEAGPISKALAAYGQANELSVAYAPETAWLNALASHITSNLSYGGDVPVSAIGSSITGPVAQAFQQAGGYGAAGQIGGGVAPISDIGVKNGQAYLPKAAGGLGSAAAALTGGGTIPGASTAPQG